MKLRTLQLLMLTALLFGQSALLVHEMDLEAHQLAESCDYCVQGQSLDHSASNTSPLFSTQVGTEPTLPYQPTHPTPANGKHYQARGPPAYLA